MSKLFTLKRLRQVIATIYFLLFTFIFIDFSNFFSSSFINEILYFQFTPSVLKFLRVGGWLATGFLVVTILTALFGRVYCSVLCPLGILQDLMARFRAKKSRYKYLVPWNIIRYSTLAIVVIFALFGFLFLLNFLDPYSFAGRIFSDIVRPLYYWGNNLLVKVLGLFDSYALHHVPFKGMPWQGMIITATLTLVLFIVSVRWGRIFCNSFCPVGAVLSLISRYSVFKLQIDKSACTLCNRCARDCKASCIDVKNQSIDFSRCVACYNCIDSCNEGGIGYSFAFKLKQELGKEIEDKSRRNFLAVSSGMILGTSLIGKTIKSLATVKSEGAEKASKSRVAGAVYNERSAPITPPGSYSLNQFLNACTACHLCVSVCPTHVIQPSLKEYGFFGLLQPHMDFHSGFCNFDCTLCGEVCPTGAIRPLQIETKQRTQTGIASFHKANCIVHVDGTDCGACSEHCPTKAVHMVPYKGLFLPEVREEICIGCGACEYACPTKPYKAIYVNGNAEHQVAELPEKYDDKPQESDMEEFPF
ncbi:MAG TPA: 4Fe-4S binding protein [Tenuifilaceae bacterium]|nr:4Fe-4S binding protein [Tenuifilaceae bacterium]